MLEWLGHRRRPGSQPRDAHGARRERTDAGFACHELAAPGGRWLASAPDAAGSPCRVRLQVHDGSAARVLLCVAKRDRRFGWLIARNGAELAIAGFPMTGVAIPVRLERGWPADPVGLVHPLEAISRLAPAGGDPLGDEVGFDYRVPIRFVLDATETAALPAQMAALAREIAAAVRLPVRWEDIVADLATGAVRPALAEAVLCRLPADELEALAHSLLTSRRTRALLRRCMKENAWLTTRLGALIAWRDKRDAAASFISSSPNVADIPGERGHLSYRPQLGLALHALMRRSIRPRRTACVLGSARNEGPYLLEWIAYHRAIGFDHVFLYTNDNSDGSDALLERLARAGIITWVKNGLGPKVIPQFRAYAHALSVLPQTLDYRWTLIADVDEYMAYDTMRFVSLGDFLAWHEIQHSEAIALPWLIHVGEAGDIYSDTPCVGRFPRREKTVNHHIKSLFRTNLFWSANCHYPYASLWRPVNYNAENGATHEAKAPENNKALARNPQASHAWISHYIFRSAGEALMKTLRGPGDQLQGERRERFDDTMKRFMRLASNPDTIADRRTELCGAGLSAELARLRGIPGVAAADASIKAGYRAEMDRVCLDVIRSGARQSEATECTRFRSLLLGQVERRPHPSAAAGTIFSAGQCPRHVVQAA